MQDVQMPLAARRPQSPGRLRAARRRSCVCGAPVLALLAALALGGCGGSSLSIPATSAAAGPPPGVPAGCSGAVLNAFSAVLQRVYREGVLSERTASAEYLIARSRALRRAVENDDAAGAHTAVDALLKTGHLTNVAITHAGHTLVEVGGPALAPLHGTLTNARGIPIASYLASVWAAEGFLTEAGGITHGLVALRAGSREIDGSPSLPEGPLPDEGSLTRAGTVYGYTSFPVEA
ncbi:MAG TPA: hypothetical protein VED41_12170, partial [Solirubrobacteraceae bacterium]|nr:hypothetical protein [Solirubrobacteraceae bacterium]